MARTRITNVAEMEPPQPEGLSGPRAQWAGEPPAPGQPSYAALTPPSIPAAKEPPQAAARRQPRISRLSSERWRMASSLLLSLLIHGSLLSLTFGVSGLGLPGLRFPWQERRIEAPELRVVLVPAPLTPAEPAIESFARPAQQASIEPHVAGGRAPAPPASPAPPLRRGALEIVPLAKPKAEATPERSAVASGAPAKAPVRVGETGRAVPAKIPKPASIDMKPSGKPVAPAAPRAPTSVVAVAPSASIPETVMSVHRDGSDVAGERIGQDIRERAAEFAKQADRSKAARVEAAKRDAARQEEAARVEAARLEAERQEAVRLASAQLEAQRLEAARQEAAARIEAARRLAAQLETERLLAARQEADRVEATRAAQLETQRQEAARQEAAARTEAARLEVERREAARLAAAQPKAERQEAARQEADRGAASRPDAESQEAARKAAARQEVARVEAEEDARREARRRAIGRQLDEEAAQREAASNATRQLPLSLSTARRARLWGRGDPNVELVLYAEGWARKIQSSTPVETVREVAKKPHTHPMLTVAIRSDGSVESVTFVISSGVAEVDEAIRRIVQSHEHYQAFPPALAREYDVIEIRRTWHFDDAVRLY